MKITKTITLILITLLNIVVIPVKSQDNTLYVDTFISGASLGGISAAIQLTRDNQSFLLQEETNGIGGQPTTQGVTAWDDHGKLFQNNSVYSSIKSVTTIKERFPLIVEDKMKAELGNNLDKIILNTEIKDVVMSGQTIDYITTKNLITNETKKIKAKYYLDASDFATLTVKAGVPYRVGVDSFEETGEKPVLTNDERNKFFNGFMYSGINYQGFGNRIQPVTVPFSIIDKGYVGIKKDYSHIITANSSYTDLFSPLSKGENVLTFVFNNVEANPVFKFKGVQTLPFKMVTENNKKIFQFDFSATQIFNFFEISNFSNTDINLESLIITRKDDLNQDSMIERYNQTIIDNLQWYINVYEIPNFDAGDYTIEITNLNNNQVNIPVRVKVSSNVIYDQILNFGASETKKITDFNSIGGLFRIYFKADCDKSCQENFRIIIKEKAPKNYNKDEFNWLLTYPGFTRPYISYNTSGTFFQYRMNIAPDKLQANSYITPELKTLASYRSMGITQVNTPGNDYNLSEVDLNRYFKDSEYRREIEKEALKLSQRYYYWLKYDQPKSYLKCDTSELFCATKRIMLVPDLNGTETGYSREPYVRETLRPMGEATLTYKDLAWLENRCNTDSCTQLEFRSYKPDGTYNSKIENVNVEFLQRVPKDALAGFYYPTDVHSLFANDEEKSRFARFRDLIRPNNPTDDDMPIYMNGLFNDKVISGTMRLAYMYNRNFDNLLFCGKNISVTQISNGSTRLHPGESAIGQACGVISKYLIGNNLNSVHELNGGNNLINIQKQQIDAGMLPLPVEDGEISELKKAGKNDVIKSYLSLLFDSIVKYDISQNSKYQYTLFKFAPKKAVTKEELKTFFEKKGINYQNLDTWNATVSGLQSLVSDEWYSSIIIKINAYKEDTKYINALKEPLNDILQRGELAVIY